MNESYNLLQKHFDTAFDTPDGIKKLRELILTLAMQGKLVPQDPNDQPASELLKEIAAEKARLIKAGKLKPQKPLPPIKPEEIPFKIPANWQWSCLGEISLDSESGWSPQCLPISRSNDDEWGVLKVSAVSWGEFKPDENKSLPHKIQPKPECEVKTGDFLLSRANTEELVARSVIVEQCPPKLMMSDKIVRFSLSEKVYKRFVNIANGSSYARSFYQDHASGTSSSMKNVTRTVMCELPIPLPPIAEQKRIVARIEQLMGRCDELERLRAERDRMRLDTHAAAINQLLSASDSENFSSAWRFITSNFAELYSVKENVAELRKTILQLAVMGKLVPQNPTDQPASELLKEIAAEKARLIKAGKLKPQKPLPQINPEEIPYQIPSNWQWVRFGDIALIERGGSPRPIKAYLTDDPNGLNWIKIGDTDQGGKYITSTNEKIRQEGLAKTRMVYPGDFLLTNSMSFGRPYITKIEGCIHDGWLRISPPDSLEKDFLYHLLSSSFVRKMFELAAAGAVVLNLNSEKVRELPIPLPPIAEQKRIVARIEQLMALCDNLEKSIAAAGDGRTALLNAMMAKV